MSTEREWKPGDVAMVTLPDGWELRCSFYDTGGERGWYHGEGLTSQHYVAEEGHVPARPLVVIDPEDREQVERLLRACPTDWGFEQDAETFRECAEEVQAALRSLIEPPKPPKPKPLLDRLKERAPDGLIDPALAEQVVKEWLADNAEEMSS